MIRGRRLARLIVGLSALAFGAFVALQFKHRDLPVPGASVAGPRTEPGAVVETTGGRTVRFSQSNETVHVTSEKQLTYEDGRSRLVGVTVVAEDTNGEGTFTATGKEASIGKDENTIELNGDVHLESKSIHARTEHATFSKTDNIVRSPGPTEASEGKTSARGIGMTFDRNADVLTILDQAVVTMADANGGSPAEITCGVATLARRDHYRRFERGVRMQRSGQLLEADTVIVHLADDDQRVVSVELQQHSRISTANAAVGALQSMTGHNMNLEYSAGGGALEHVLIDQEAVVTLTGEAGKAGRQIVATTMDIRLAPDGTTPVALFARDNVQLTLPAEPGVGERTIRATTLDGKGEPGRGLTRALFAGGVQYREGGSGTNAAKAASASTLDVGLKPGLSAIEDARFAHAVRFEQGQLGAQAAAARYDLEKGTLALSGSEPGNLAPHLVTEQITVDAQKIDLTLEGPKVKAAGAVKSVLQPAKKGQSTNDVKMPSMLKQDQPVNVLGNDLDYDGTKSSGVYTGDARLFQGDTSVKASTIAIDDKSGNLSASGDVVSTTMLERTATPRGGGPATTERVHSIAKAKDMKYDDAARRLTYTGDAQLSNPDGTMTAERIELYLKPSGDELDRAEAYNSLTLREQNRKTTGARLTYTADDERYVVTGAPVTIVDECGRETVGKTLTFYKATDNIVVDGDQQIRTQTKGGGKCTS
ncbi:MAG TPA: LPS export ABC transporter periplasmic protein LptC [Vicinamibacterales bacterium]|nr:LPS export ABC transporter periplasmic protein LptC [Vicinamibacterales bacterium]